MPPVHFNVTQVCVASTCPRILYFDAVQAKTNPAARPTRLWRQGDEGSAAGGLFHNSVDVFHREHRRLFALPELVAVLTPKPNRDAVAAAILSVFYWECVDHEALAAKDGEQQQAFLNVVKNYTSELADVLIYAFGQGRETETVAEELFADKRRRVDVTFPVGAAGEPVHVTGILDYVFHDWRSGADRILDYKLLPPSSADKFQVGLYALMHHVQHGTKPSAGVLYLHPRRELHELSWKEVEASRATVFNLLASMREWVRFDETTGTGLKPPGEPAVCSRCRWSDECPKRLGPVATGERLKHWTTETAAPVRPEVRPPVAEPVAGENLWIGQGNDGKPTEIPISSLPTHVAVVGAAGSGKTWLAKVIAEEAALAGVAVLAIDPQGDLVQFLRPADPAGLSAATRKRATRFRQGTDVRVLTPGTDHGVRVSLNPLKLPETGGADVDDLLATTAGHLVTLAKASGEIESQKTFVYQLLRALTAGSTRDLSLGGIAAALRDPAAAGLEDPDRFVRKAERERLARQLNNLEQGPSSRLFTGGRPLDLGWLVTPSAPGRTPFNVVYLNALADDAEKQGFVASLAVEVYRWMIVSGSTGGRPRLLFYLDEAKDYLPAGAAQPPAKKPLLRLFAQGRKYGVACLVCTQSPRSVDYNVFGNCSTKLIGRLESSQDVERVRDWFAPQGPPPSWVADRVGAAKGTFVGRWPELPGGVDGVSFKSRQLLTAHEGAWSPERVATETAAIGNGTKE
ncbi:helicase HerA-like domain-containing protein [Zavarzinella formosa]|uniref:helicase HerA-like domain-containing protein n=1 Tax=Zavarzinella formosa TaxID=360055 RepID=UPI00031E938B|nr:helicase HerA-like domain-containing protein [Zavarzinella formosa]